MKLFQIETIWMKPPEWLCFYRFGVVISASGMMRNHKTGGNFSMGEACLRKNVSKSNASHEPIRVSPKIKGIYGSISVKFRQYYRCWFFSVQFCVIISDRTDD